MAKSGISLISAAMLLAVAGCGDGEEAGGGVAAEPATRAGSASGASAPVETGTTKPDVAAESPLGAALDRPERYYGLYAAPSRPDRDWFIAEARKPEYAEFAPDVPPGHLMLGAMFGDVAPWHLKTLSETEFVQARMNPGQSEPIVIEFRLGADGGAEAFRFTGGGFARDEWLERTGQLPEDW